MFVQQKVNFDSQPPGVKSTKVEVSHTSDEKKESDLLSLLKGVVVQTLTEHPGPWNNFGQDRPLYPDWCPVPAYHVKRDKSAGRANPNKTNVPNQMEIKSKNKQAEVS